MRTLLCFSLALLLHQGVVKAQVRVIDFYNQKPAQDSVAAKARLSIHNIGSGQDFYIRLYRLRSLAEELSALSRHIPKEKLLEHGNYEFRFLVDGREVYRERLHPGALLPEAKSADYPLNLAFICSSCPGLWSTNLWERFMLKSGMNIFGAKPRELSLEVRAWLDDRGIHTSALLAKGSITLTCTYPTVDASLSAPQIIRDNSSWDRSAENYNRQLITALNERVYQKAFKDITSIIVIKNNKLLIEAYFNGAGRDSLHDSRSVTKSITGSLVGMAINDGFLRSETDSLGSFYSLKDYKNYSPQKEAIRLRDLLTMSSAFEGDDNLELSPGNEEQMYPSPDYARFALDLPMDKTKKNGKQWAYFTAGTMLLGDILEQKIPGGLEVYARQRLFSPLGITSFEWARTPQGKPFTGGGLRLRPLDLARFGQLYKNKGMWRGQQIIPAAWVEQSFRHWLRLPADNPGPGFYGFLFWNKTFTVQGKKYEVNYSSGNGGNKIFIVRDIPLIVVITTRAYGKGYAHEQSDKIMETYILPAVL